MNMADRIQHLRKSKGISQEELADKVGVSRQAVSKWESEQSTPDIEKVILLSDFFDVTTDYLLKGIEPVSENITKKSDARIFSLVVIIFVIGQFIGENKEKASFWFWTVNVWIVILIPISCVFNAMQGILGGHWWTFRPTPELGNSIGFYVLCWGFYFAVCIIVDLLLIKHAKR